MRIRLGSHILQHKNVKPGDFVTKVGWYSDCWAEVLSVSNTPGFKSVTVATPYKDCGHDSIFEFLPGENTRYFQVVDVCPRRLLKSRKPRIVHLKEGSYGYALTKKNTQNNPRILPGWPSFLS